LGPGGDGFGVVVGQHSKLAIWISACSRAMRLAFAPRCARGEQGVHLVARLGAEVGEAVIVDRRHFEDPGVGVRGRGDDGHFERVELVQFVDAVVAAFAHDCEVADGQ
jgi:hypothetical protein